MSEIPQASLRDVLRSSHRFAVYFASVALSGAIGGVIIGRAPFYAIFLAPALGYSLYFILPLVLQLSGAATTDLNINLWFAWALCGGLAFFMVGLITKGHELFATMADILRTGLLCAAAWITGVVIVWLVRRTWLKRGA